MARPTAGFTVLTPGDCFNNVSGNRNGTGTIYGDSKVRRPIIVDNLVVFNHRIFSQGYAYTAPVGGYDVVRYGIIGNREIPVSLKLQSFMTVVKFVIENPVVVGCYSYCIVV